MSNNGDCATKRKKPFVIFFSSEIEHNEQYYIKLHPKHNMFLWAIIILEITCNPQILFPYQPHCSWVYNQMSVTNARVHQPLEKVFVLSDKFHNLKCGTLPYFFATFLPCQKFSSNIQTHPRKRKKSKKSQEKPIY